MQIAQSRILDVFFFLVVFPILFIFTFVYIMEEYYLKQGHHIYISVLTVIITTCKGVIVVAGDRAQSTGHGSSDRIPSNIETRQTGQGGETVGDRPPYKVALQVDVLDQL